MQDLLRLETDPRPVGVQMLNSDEKLFRVYVGPGKNYRAIYQIADAKLLVLVVRVGDRRMSTDECDLYFQRQRDEDLNTRCILSWLKVR